METIIIKSAIRCTVLITNAKKKKIQLAIDEFHWGQVWVCSLLSLSVFLE